MVRLPIVGRHFTALSTSRKRMSSGFSSKAEGIDVVSRALAQKYLRPGASLYSGKTISDVNKRYAASSTWDDKVASRMASYYATISKNHNAALEKLK